MRFLCVTSLIFTAVNIAAIEMWTQPISKPSPVLEPSQSEIADVRFEPNSFDLQDIGVNREVEFSGRIVNDAPESMRITSIDTSCGCSDIDFESRKIAGNSSIKFRAALRARSKPGSYRVEIRVYLVSASAGQSVEAKLQVISHVVSVLSVSDDSFVLIPKPDADEAAFATVEITNTSESTLHVDAELIDCPDLGLQNRSLTLKPFARKTFELKCPADAKPCKGILHLSVDTIGESRSIPVGIRPKHAVEAVPSKLMLGMVTRESDELKSSLRPEVRLVGDIDPDSIRFLHLPPLLKDPILSVAEGEVKVVFSLNSGGLKDRVIEDEIAIEVADRETKRPRNLQIKVGGVWYADSD